MTTHTLALIVLGFAIAGEGYALADNKSFEWNWKLAISLPFTVFLYWLLVTVLT